MAQFHSNLFDESDQDTITTATHIRIIFQFILTKQIITPFLKTMWDHTDGCSNQYSCSCAIYLLSCLSLEFVLLLTEQ